MVPARQAVPLPDGVSFELGASLGVPAVTADRCLFAAGPLSGKAVLVAAVAGVSSALAAGALTELPVRRFPLSEIAAAHEAVERGVTGKVLVIP